jgi:hypothetical protein
VCERTADLETTRRYGKFRLRDEPKRPDEKSEQELQEPRLGISSVPGQHRYFEYIRNSCDNELRTARLVWEGLMTYKNRCKTGNEMKPSYTGCVSHSVVDNSTGEGIHGLVCGFFVPWWHRVYTAVRVTIYAEYVCGMLSPTARVGLEA